MLGLTVPGPSNDSCSCPLAYQLPLQPPLNSSKLEAAVSLLLIIGHPSNEPLVLPLPGLFAASVRLNTAPSQVTLKSEKDGMVESYVNDPAISGTGVPFDVKKLISNIETESAIANEPNPASKPTINNMRIMVPFG